MSLQAQRDDVQGDLDSYRTETNNYMNAKNKQMKADMKAHEDLTREGQILQRKIRDGDNTIQSLEKKLVEMREEFEIIKEQHQRDVKGLEVSFF